MLLLHVLQGRAHAFHDRDLAGAKAAHDFEADHRLTVQERDAAPFGNGVFDRRDIVETNAAPIGERDFHGSEFGRRLHGGDGAHRLFGAADVGASARRFLLHLAQLARDVGGRGLERQQLVRVEFDTNLAIDAADARYRADALDAEHGLGDVVVDEPGQRLVVHLVRGDGVGEHRRTGQVGLRNDRVAHLAGQIGAYAGDGVAHFLGRLLRHFFKDEFDGQRHRAVLHLGIDVLDALQRGDRVLDLARDLGFELGGRGAGQRCRDDHHRQVDVGEVLDFHRAKTHQSDECQQQEKQDRRNRVFDRPGGNVHHCAVLISARRRRQPPVRRRARCRHRRGSRHRSRRSSAWHRYR